jgi:hypothetical protein
MEGPEKSASLAAEISNVAIADLGEVEVEIGISLRESIPIPWK